MADLNDLQSASSVKIAGATSSGSETGFIESRNGRLKVDANFDFDLIGQQQVTTPISIFNSFHDFDINNIYWNTTTTGGATATWNSNTRAINLTVSGASQSVIRRTKRRFPYLTGHDRQVDFTCTFPSSTDSNYIVKEGMFDDSDGIYLRKQGSQFSVVIRTSVSGSLVEHSYLRGTDWDDDLDGTGPSGVTVDFTKRQLYRIKYAWQGVGIRRLGVLVNNEIINFLTLSQEDLANEESYMRTPNLPYTYSIETVGTITGSIVHRHACTTVSNSGSGTPTKTPRSVNTGIVSKTVGSSAIVPVLSMRATSANARAVIEYIEASLYATGNSDILMEIYINNTLTGASWSSVPGYCEIDTSATALTNGVRVYSTYIKAGTSLTFQSTEMFRFIDNMVGVLDDGSTSILTIAARAFSGNAPCYAAINYREV